MTDDDDYERVEAYIEDYDDMLVMYGENSYDKLPDTKKEQFFIDQFFKGQSAYAQSAEELRIGYDAYRQNNVNANEEVFHFMRRGKTIHAVRDTQTGKIKRWIK